MSLLVLIPLSIGLGLLGLLAFIWALNNDQFDDPEGNACRVLLNDSPPPLKGQPHDNLAPHIDDKDT
jgi:cbb3-type cytochrome oxidase maturation protein